MDLGAALFRSSGLAIIRPPILRHSVIRQTHGMDCPVSEIRSLARPKARTPGLRFGGVLIALCACCGCQLIGRERPVPKQMAASRQLSQRGISALERSEWDKAEMLLSQAI